jgi:hypothetical protein
VTVRVLERWRMLDSDEYCDATSDREVMEIDMRRVRRPNSLFIPKYLLIMGLVLLVASCGATDQRPTELAPAAVPAPQPDPGLESEPEPEPEPDPDPEPEADPEPEPETPLEPEPEPEPVPEPEHEPLSEPEFGTYGSDPQFDRLYEDCADGDWYACEELFWSSPPGSEYGTFANETSLAIVIQEFELQWNKLSDPPLVTGGEDACRFLSNKTLKPEVMGSAMLEGTDLPLEPALVDLFAAFLLEKCDLPPD